MPNRAPPETKTGMNATRIAAITGFLAVALGAFGAHGLKDLLERNGTLAIWQTAVLYHLTHAIVLLFLSTRPWKAVSKAFGFFGSGILLFSGSLYLLAITHIKWLGAITPLGGLCLLAGWLILAFKKPEEP